MGIFLRFLRCKTVEVKPPLRRKHRRRRSCSVSLEKLRNQGTVSGGRGGPEGHVCVISVARIHRLAWLPLLTGGGKVVQPEKIPSHSRSEIKIKNSFRGATGSKYSLEHKLFISQ